MAASRFNQSVLRRVVPALSRANPGRSQVPLPQRSFLRVGRQQRFASYQRWPGPGRTQYSRFDSPGGSRLQILWRNHRILILGVGAGGGTFYVYNLEEVPVTHRRRFNCVSPATEKRISGGGYEQILQQFQGKILPDNHPYTQLVAKVVERLLPSTGGLAADTWKVHVIDEPDQKNAFVMPGGKVFIFTGILPICQDEDGIAAVLGHEIAHNVAHHTAERMSRSFFIVLIAMTAAYLFDVSGQSSRFIAELLLSLPNSRTQETEADHIGLLMMAESCYDPEAAVGLWRRMKQAEKGAPPQFLSTHPSSDTRIDTIKGWLPEAKEKQESSKCGSISGYTREFKQAFGGRQPPLVAGQPSRRQDDDDFW